MKENQHIEELKLKEIRIRESFLSAMESGKVSERPEEQILIQFRASLNIYKQLFIRRLCGSLYKKKPRDKLFYAFFGVFILLICSA